MNLPAFCPKSDWVRTEVKDLPAWPVIDFLKDHRWERFPNFLPPAN